MNLIIIAGFLGSGKTTVLLNIARSLADGGLKVAVIENEVGKIGIDDKVLAEEGIVNLRKLFSGCVCCQLRVDLLSNHFNQFTPLV